MELTILPLTAILLLLSGVVSPMAAAGSPPAIACVRLWFGLDSVRSTRLRRNRLCAGSARACSAAQRRSRKVGGLRLATHVRAIVAKHRRARLRTRFGASGAAYRSMAPPVLAS